MKPTYYAFPSDEYLPYDALWRTKLDYIVIGEYMRAGAETFGIEISAATMERWFRLWSSIYHLDYLIDETALDLHAKAAEVYASLVHDEPIQLPEWVNPDIVPISSLFFNSVRDLDNIARMRVGFMEALECSRRKAAARTVKEYAAVLREELSLVAELVVVCMTSKERDTGKLQVFHRWVRVVSVAFGQFDAAVDLGRDFAKARVSVKPTTSNCVRILVRAMYWGLKLSRYPRATRAAVLYERYFWHKGGDADWRTAQEEAQELRYQQLRAEGE